MTDFEVHPVGTEAIKITTGEVTTTIEWGWE